MGKIGYLGPKGSFSEEALYLFLSNEGDWADNLEQLPFHTIPKLLRACDTQEIDFAFVPLENSTEGQVGVTLDTLAQTEHALIIREFIHPVRQCLLTNDDIPLSAITRVYSHEQALGQCREFLETHLAHAEQRVCLSTAEAASKVAAVRENWAAIGPQRAAELYNLRIKEKNIQDESLNATRFILVGHHVSEMSGNDKTSLLVRAENVPGSLYNILKEFAHRNINLTRIESRPAKRKLGEYVFFIDVDGYVFSEPIQSVLYSLRERNVYVKLLGSYPKALAEELVF